MSLFGTPWQQPGIINGSSGYGQLSNGHQQQQQQQHKPPNTLSGASIPTVLASSPLQPSNLGSDCHSDCQGQMVPRGKIDAAATQEGSKITLVEDEVKFGCGKAEGVTTAELQGPPSFKMQVLKIEDKGYIGEDEHRVARGSLGSAGQSPSSPISSHSSPSSSLPSPSVLPGRSFPISESSDCMRSASNKEGSDIQGSQLSNQVGQLRERNTLSPCFIDSTRSNTGSTEDEEKLVIYATSFGMSRNQTLSVGKQNVTQSTSSQVKAEPLLSKFDAPAGPGAALPPAVGATGIGVSMVERESALNNPEKDMTGLCRQPCRDVTDAASHGSLQDVSHPEDRRVGSYTLNKQTKNSQCNELPQRTAVRRAISDCSHLSVPMVMAGTYPSGMGGSPVMIPNMSNFAPMGTVCLPRPPYPHVAVRRSLTVTDGTEAAAAMATMMTPPLMTSPVMPSSPPPKRHHGSCETNFLLAVPPPAGASTQDKKINITGKFPVCVRMDLKINFRIF